MSDINIAPHMARKSTVRDLSGNLITLIDENDGGYIVRNRQVVNPEKWNVLVQKEKDKQEAAKAQGMQKVDANAPDRTVAPSKVDALEKKVAGMENNIAEILKLLQK